MEEDASSERDRGLFDFLEASLRHKSDMVIYEAASAICSLTTLLKAPSLEYTTAQPSWPPRGMIPGSRLLSTPRRSQEAAMRLALIKR